MIKKRKKTIKIDNGTHVVSNIVSFKYFEAIPSNTISYDRRSKSFIKRSYHHNREPHHLTHDEVLGYGSYLIIDHVVYEKPYIIINTKTDELRKKFDSEKKAKKYEKYLDKILNF